MGPAKAREENACTAAITNAARENFEEDLTGLVLAHNLSFGVLGGHKKKREAWLSLDRQPKNSSGAGLLRPR